MANVQEPLVGATASCPGMHGQTKSQLHVSKYWPLTFHAGVAIFAPLWLTIISYTSGEVPAPAIQTTTVGSYPVPDWLAALPSEQARLDATRVVFDTQRQAGIDLPTDGELYRFDVNNPDTNGMIEYFVRPMTGVRTQAGRGDYDIYSRKSATKFRRKPPGVVEGALGEGSLNLLADCELAASVAGGPFKFTVTSPYMLARTLLDHHYQNFEE